MSVLLTNLLPLVGVLWFEWTPDTLIAIYALEMLLALPLAGGKALFAAQPPYADRDGGLISVTNSELVEKRGSSELVEWLPAIYPRNLPFVSHVIFVAIWFVVILGIVLFEVVLVVEAIDVPTVLVAALALFVGQGVETWTTYIRNGGYATSSPYTVVETPARQACFLLLILFVTPRAIPDVETVVLVGFVLVKLLVEWSGIRAERGESGRLTAWLSGPDPEDGQAAPPDVPAESPSVVVRTHRPAVALHAVIEALTNRAPIYAPPVTIGWLLVGSLLLGGDSGTDFLLTGLVAIGLFVFLVAMDIVECVLTYDAMEYQRRGDQLVAVDTRVETVQWSVPVDTLRDVDVVERRLADRYFGTRTFRVTAGSTTDNIERRLGPVAAPDRLVAAFELPIWEVDLAPLDRRFVAATVSAIVLVVAAVLVVLATPVVPANGLLFLFLLAPFIAFPINGLWWLAHRE